MTVAEPWGSGAEERLMAGLEGAYAAATAAGEGIRTYRLAGAPVQVRISGAGMGRILRPALEPWACAAESAPALTVVAWDTASTAVAPPSPPEDERPPAGSSPRFTRVLQRGAGLFTMYDRARRLAIVHAADARAVPTNELAGPLRMVLHFWLQQRGMQLVHAGAVGDDSGGVLIVGRSGAGKSSVALTCLAAGMRFAGDDYVAVDAGLPRRAHALFASAKLEPHHLVRFPAFATAVVNAREVPPEKAVMLLAKGWRASLAPALDVRAVVLPRVTGVDRPRLIRTRPVEALAALAPSTLFQLPERRGETLGALARLLGDLPVWVLELGGAMDEVPDLMRRLTRST